jgi:RND family efflux transporter MFP subunit
LVIPPPESPYPDSIACTGIVESPSGNIDIGTSVSGVITEIYVEVGHGVNEGEPLFKVDDRGLRAELLTAIAKTDLARTAVQKPEHRLQYLENLKQSDANAVSVSELIDLQDNLAEAQASLALAKAEVDRVQTEIARHTIRAPADGKVLQLHTRVGEYAEAAKSASPIMVFGRDENLWVRVDIDETVIWRFRPGADAVAYLRGNTESQMPLRFEYVEPFVLPKQSLTGQSTERPDVRVLQALFSFKNVERPIFVGQRLDVFIDAGPVSQQDGESEQ